MKQREFLALFLSLTAVNCDGSTDVPAETATILSTATTTSTVEPDEVEIRIVAHAGDVNLADATVSIKVGETVLDETPFGEYQDNPYRYDRNNGPLKSLMLISVQLNGYYSPDAMLMNSELEAAEDGVTVDVVLARDVRGTDWICAAQWIVDNEPSGEPEEKPNAVIMALEPPCNCMSLYLDTWWETVEIVGNTISGEKDIVFYTGEAKSNDEFFFTRWAEDDPNDGLRFSCAR